MKTIKEITLALQQATVKEQWIIDLQQDERKGVQKALQQFEKRLAKVEALYDKYNEKCQFDEQFRTHGTYIAGVDEAGRGPLAGPVVTAAVILPSRCEALIELDDSKQISKNKREALASLVKEHALAYAIHFQPVQVIDEINIYEATKKSMAQSVKDLTLTPDCVLVDAMTLPITQAQENIIKGDAQSLAIAAASILAKTARDAYMAQLHEQFPQYGFAQHAGYGTKEHLEALAKYGIIAEHRKTFEPIKTMIQK